MKKIKVLLSLIMMITMLVSFSLPVYAAEIEYSDHGGMVMTKGYNPFGIDGNDSLKINSEVKHQLGVQDSENVIKIYNLSMSMAFSKGVFILYVFIGGNGNEHYRTC